MDKVYDLAEFSIPKLAAELPHHALRFALESNIYGADMTFTVRCLSAPIPMGANEMAAIVAFMKTANMDTLGGQKAFSFKGRIIGEPGRPSPHDFLPIYFHHFFIFQT